MKALIADDNKENQYLLKTILASEGYDVFCAENGKKALEILNDNPVDVIISDILMPKMDGFRLCNICKNDEKLKNIPLILLSSNYIGKKDEEFAALLGADKFLTRPIDPDEFLNILKAVTDKAKNRSESVSLILNENTLEFMKMYNDRIVEQLERKVEELENDILLREKAENALIESENLFRTLYESATVGIALVNKDGYFFRVNDRVCGILGYTREELIQLKFNDITYSEDKNISISLLRNMLAGEFENAVLEKRYIRKDGKVIWTNLLISAIRGNNGDFRYFVTYLHDITERKAVTDRINKALEGTIETLALVVEARDPYTSGHQKRTADIAVAIAKNLGLPDNQIHGIRLASIIHDLGKIQIPAEILSKPGKLTNIEYELIKCHPETAYNLLKSIEFPWPIAEIIYQHHERLDGSGYPRKLTSDSILTEAKILGVADVVEAMSTHRPYRAAYPIEEALDEIDKYKGLRYDAKVVEACLKVFLETCCSA